MSRRPRTAIARFVDPQAAQRARAALTRLGVSEAQAAVLCDVDCVRLRVELRGAEERAIVQSLLSSEALRVEIHDADG
ncbi:MAG: hypothetical protein ABS75_03585 [Pelagibacterium sp. SCN 63-23]|nr:MAG: hypothetical protein ABS75_03585 [Pelagibacterium sp. SCN 63-23]